MFTYIVDQANKMCHKADVIIAYSTRKETPENFKEYFDENIKLIKVKNFTRNLNPIKDIKAMMEVRNIVKEEKPDIVHMHSSKAGGIGRLAISSKNVKLFYTPHGYSFCQKNESKLKIYLYKLLEKILAKRNCKTIACSKSEYEETLKLTKNCTYVENGINIEEIDKWTINKTQPKIDIDNLKICTIGRIEHQKNPKLFNKIAEKLPEVQFSWIGDGELRDELKAPNINVLGWCQREDVVKELYKNDIFILTSLWEGLSMTLLEAMYLKKICIVSDIDGNRNAIKDGKNGFLCDSEEKYCEIIKKIINREIDTKKIGEEANKEIIINHNVNRVQEEYFKIYCEGDDCYQGIGFKTIY